MLLQSPHHRSPSPSLIMQSSWQQTAYLEAKQVKLVLLSRTTIKLTQKIKASPRVLAPLHKAFLIYSKSILMVNSPLTMPTSSFLICRLHLTNQLSQFCYRFRVKIVGNQSYLYKKRVVVYRLKITKVTLAL